VLEKATVVYNSDVVTAATLCEEVEDVGFEATMLSNGPASKLQDEGQATLHLQVGAELIEPIGSLARSIDGVISCQAVDEHVIRVSYRPAAVGARSLLGHLIDKFPERAIRCAPPQDNKQIVDLQRNVSRLWSNFMYSAVPAFLVFVITIILPSFDVDLGTIDCKYIHVHIFTVVVLALATPVQFIFGAEFHIQARKALARGAPNMDVLVSVATHISYGYAILVLLIKVCKALGPHSMAAAGSMHDGHHQSMAATGSTHDGMHLVFGLECHALHFFGMAPILIAVVLGGKLIEAKAKIQTMESLVRLMECKSHTAQLVMDEKEEAIPVELVQVADRLRLFEGSQIPVDGTLISEAPIWVSEAILTGESTPTEKKPGSLLMGGATVVGGSGIMKATTVGSKTALGEIMTLISNAQATKTKAQQMANTVAGCFVTSVMACSVLVFATWFFLVYTGRVALPKEMDSASTLDLALFAAKFGVAVLMVACPCAMGLATPTAVMVSTGVAAKMGCLVKSAEALEEGARVRAVVLDKTGTITEGAPRVSCTLVSLAPLAQLPGLAVGGGGGGGNDAAAVQGVPPPTWHLGGTPDPTLLGSRSAEALERGFWRLVGAAEAGSDHPLAKCLTEAAKAATGCATFAAPEQFRYRVGRGVSAVLEGVDVRVGSFAFLEDSLRELRQSLPDEAGMQEVEAWAAERKASSDSVVVVHAVAQKRVVLLGALAVRDAVRADAASVVRHLEGQGVEVWMCTGDCASTAHAIAKEVGIPEARVHAEALPKQKADKVNALKSQSTGAVCFVGDGVNDAPALAAADVGIAIGAGAHLAMDAADVVLVRSELAPLAAYVKLCKETRFTIMRNFAWAFVFNFCGLPLAAGIFYPRVVLPPLAAGLAMGLSSTMVVTSSLMLRFFRPPALSEWSTCTRT